MNYLVLCVDNFEDVELIATVDVLSRAGESITCASLMGRKEIKTKVGHGLIVNALIEEVDLSNYDALIIPGGPGSFKIMPSLPVVNDIISFFAKNNKLVASICAAPHLVGKLGYLKDKNFTVHPGFEDQIIGGTYLREKGVVVDGNFITAKSMYYSIEFGLAIIEYFHGKDFKDKLELSLKGEH